MERRVINPWTWQDAFGFAQAIETKNATRTLTVSGQTAVDANGAAVHAGDIAAQADYALANLEKVLADADMTLSDIVRLTIYTTDVDALLAAYQPLAKRLADGKCVCAQTLLGVQRLAFPELMIEIEATAMA